jgi:hypothetical protein
MVALLSLKFYLPADTHYSILRLPHRLNKGVSQASKQEKEEDSQSLAYAGASFQFHLKGFRKEQHSLS